MEMNEKPTLYIGAHEDDVFISSAISINRYPNNAYVLCVADGVSCEKYPANFFGIDFNSKQEFVQRRLKEDMQAFEGLGLDVTNKYINLQLPNERTYEYISKIVGCIKDLTSKRGIEKLVTHAFPEAHPDHEVVSFCSHMASLETGIEVWEYPMYAYNKGGVRVDRQFVDDLHIETDEVLFGPTEFRLRERLIRGYQSQAFIIDRFKAFSEFFGRVKRDFKDIPKTRYFYVEEQGHPRPEDIRRAIKRYIASKSV